MACLGLEEVIIETTCPLHVDTVERDVVKQSPDTCRKANNCFTQLREKITQTGRDSNEPCRHPRAVLIQRKVIGLDCTLTRLDTNLEKEDIRKRTTQAHW